MSDADIALILHRLDKQDETLTRIHEEVRRTNGRVSSLEIEEAKWQAREEAAKTQRTIIATVISGGMLAAIVWFVSTAI
jgi:phage shock protein A